MKWSLTKFNLADLQSYEKNPRTLTEKQHCMLSDSIDRFGLIDKPVVNLDMTVIGGHQRIEVLLARGETEVECWVPSVCLDDRDVEELNIRLNRNNGEWDYDILANAFETGDLLSWGFDEDDLGLGSAEKPKKEPKPVITLEFSDKEAMISCIQKCEEIAQESSAKMKVKG